MSRIIANDKNLKYGLKLNLSSEIPINKKEAEHNNILSSSVVKDKLFSIKNKIKLNKKITPPISGVALLCNFFFWSG